jgi:hypothetical protein
VFVNRVLRRIFAPKRDGATRKQRKLNNEDLRNFYSSQNIFWADQVKEDGEERNRYKVLLGKPEGKKVLGRPRRRWEDGN